MMQGASVSVKAARSLLLCQQTLVVRTPDTGNGALKREHAA